MTEYKYLYYPDYDFDPDKWEGTLREDFAWPSDVKGASVSTEYVDMKPTGIMVIKKGYTWDFGSGPAIDTPDMVVASLVHDVGCDLTNDKHLPWRYRKKFDREFRRVLDVYGTPALRRWWCWVGVRFDALVLKLPSRLRQSDS